MCSMTYIQPQVTLPLSYLASAWTAVRTLGRKTSRRRSTENGVKSNACHDSSSNDAECLMSSKTASEVIQLLGLQDMANIVCSMSPVSLLTCPPVKTTVSQSIPSHFRVSAATFFENKYGFPESMLGNSTSPLVFPESVLGNSPSPLLHFFPHRMSNQSLSFRYTLPQQQQWRGFKTKHSKESTGVGMKKPGADESLKSLRLSIFDKFSISGNSKSSEKLTEMLSEVDTSPATQEKMKVAFAEGYLASDKKKADPEASWSALPRRIVRFALIIVTIWLFFQFLQTYSALGGSMKINVLKGERFEVNPEEINVTFDDVKGVDEAKQELTDIVEYLRDPQKFRALGAKLPKGVLLVGPPGTGKSLLARAVAGEAEVPFFHASGSEFDEIFVGTGAKRVRQLFDAAKMRTPCIIFIDEIDTVGAKRTSSQIHPYANQTINQLLSEMDGFQQNEGVIVLGATNRRDNLDRALLRPGRFDVEVRVFLPDLKGRRDILEHYLSKVKFSADVDIDKMARSTTGCTGADLENMVNQAALKAAMDGDPAVSTVHMEFARDKVLMGPAKKTRVPDEETNQITAYHEAGHALVAMFTKDATTLNKVTIIPRGHSLGLTSFVPEKEQYNMTKSQLLAEMDVSMGGRVAEELVFGPDKVTTGAAADFQMATGTATAMVKRFGMSEKVGVRVFHEEDVDTGLSFLKLNEVGPATTEMVDNEIKRLLQESYDRARVILKAHQSEHKQLAQALLKYETLDIEDVRAIIDGKPLRRNGQPSNHRPTSYPPQPGAPLPAGVPVSQICRSLDSHLQLH